MTVKLAAKFIGRSFPTTNDAIARLLEAGILKQNIVGKKRDRVFEAPEIIATFRDLERSMASSLNDTRLAPPVRPVPARLAKKN